MNKRNNVIKAITTMAVLIAIMIVFSFMSINIGGGFVITLIGVPVAIAATLYGPYVGAIMGFVWGTISIIQGVTGYDASGPILMAYSPFGLVVTCYIPRILCGGVTGLVAALNKKWDKKGFVTSLCSAALVPVLNTSLFLSCYLGYFLNSDGVQSFLNSCVTKYGFDPNNLFLFLVFGFGLNFILELAVNLVVDIPSCMYLLKAKDKMNMTLPYLDFQFKKKEVVSTTSNEETSSNQDNTSNEDLSK